MVSKYCLLISREVVNTLPRFRHGHSSVTSPAIVHPCSRLARTVTWREHSQFPDVFCRQHLFTLDFFFFSPLFLSYQHLERLTIHFFCPIVISTGMNENKSSKFESEGRIIGNSILHHGLFFLCNATFIKKYLNLKIRIKT